MYRPVPSIFINCRDTLWRNSETVGRSELGDWITRSPNLLQQASGAIPDHSRLTRDHRVSIGSLETIIASKSSPGVIHSSNPAHFAGSVGFLQMTSAAALFWRFFQKRCFLRRRVIYSKFILCATICWHDSCIAEIERALATRSGVRVRVAVPRIFKILF